MRTAGLWAVSVVALALVTGCGGPVEGQPRSDEPTTDAVPWDPCTIPDDAIDAAGLDLSTKESGIFGRDQNGFKICGWDDKPPEESFNVSIYSAAQTLDFLNDPFTYDRLQPVSVGSRDAMQYQTVGADESLNCGIAFDTTGGLVMATLITSALVDKPRGDPCTELARTVSRLDTHIPK